MRSGGATGAPGATHEEHHASLVAGLLAENQDTEVRDTGEGPHWKQKSAHPRQAVKVHLCVEFREPACSQLLGWVRPLARNRNDPPSTPAEQVRLEALKVLGTMGADDDMDERVIDAVAAARLRIAFDTRFPPPERSEA